ncbi:MAG TPA: mechanosensitive ion channel family protein [Armatimonadota bacterium]|nr:mechanosensitive ion channel family protein [Armatimonadota bacterium]
MHISVSPFLSNWFVTSGEKLWAIAKILIFFFAVRFIVYRLIGRVLRSLTERQGPTPVTAARIKTLGSLAKSTIFYVLIFIAGIMVLKVFQVDTAPVLTAAGVLGLAIGFGAQKLVRDIISGFFIVLEDQYSVGEYVTIGAVTGTIEELGMRVTRLKDDVGKLVIISNGDITQVTNHSRGPIQSVLDISVAAESNLAKVRSIIDNVGAEIAVAGVVTPPKADGIMGFDSAKITIRITGEVEPGSQNAVQSALKEKLLAAFAAEGIKVV